MTVRLSARLYSKIQPLAAPAANSGPFISFLFSLALLVGYTVFFSPVKAQDSAVDSSGKHKFTNILPDQQTTYVGVSGPEVEVNIGVIDGGDSTSSFRHPPGPHSGIQIKPDSGPLRLRKPDGITTLMRAKQKAPRQKPVARKPAKKTALAKPTATARPIEKPIEKPVSKPAPTPALKVEKEPVEKKVKAVVPATPPAVPEVPVAAIEPPSKAVSPPPPPPPVTPKSTVKRAEPPKIAATKQAPAKRAGPKNILPPKLAPKPAAKTATDQADTKVAKADAELSVSENGQLSIRFDPGSTALTLEATEQLKSLAASLGGNDGRLQLMAYADEKEPGASTARRQSLRRALTTRSFLIKLGIISTRIDVRAMGQPESGFPDRVDIINIP